MDAGWEYDMLGAIQEVSGILNMAGDRRRAELWNAYGYERATAFADLQQAFWDSRGSIMRITHPHFARRYFRAAFEGQHGDKAYLGSRLAAVLADSPNKEERDEALRLIDGLVRETEGAETMTRAIVLREAAKIGITLGNLDGVPVYIGEAARICETHGFDHTRSTVEQVAVGSGLV